MTGSKLTKKLRNKQSSIKAAVVQMVSGINLEQNLRQAENLIDKACAEGAELVVLPENCLMFSAAQLLSLASNAVQQVTIFQFLSGQAKKHKCYLVAGSIPLLADDTAKVFSSCLVFSPLGEEIARYQKIHLFDVDVEDEIGSYRESESIQAGEQVVTFDMKGVKVGLAICYDIRFPELFRELSEEGCEVLVLPSAFTYHTGSMHWEVLLRARAIENQCFMLAADQGGTHLSADGRQRETYGHSMIVDPQGKILVGLERGEGVCVSDLDFALLDKVRAQMPVLAHRRL